RRYVAGLASAFFIGNTRTGEPASAATRPQHSFGNSRIPWSRISLYRTPSSSVTTRLHRSTDAKPPVAGANANSGGGIPDTDFRREARRDPSHPPRRGPVPGER